MSDESPIRGCGVEASFARMVCVKPKGHEPLDDHQWQWIPAGYRFTGWVRWIPLDIGPHVN